MKEATLNTEWGEITVEIDGGGYYDIRHTFRLEGHSFQFEVPDVKEESEEVTVLFSRGGGYRYMSENDLVFTARLMKFAAQLVGLFNDAIRDALHAQAQAEAEEEEERRKKEAESEALVKEREEVMLHELVGEKVKVRHRHYKTMCYGTVDTRAIGYEDDNGTRGEPNEWRPVVRYSDQGVTRDSGVASYARLDVKTERGWRTVWDDGKDDLPEYDRAVKLPQTKPWSE
jgi:DNA-binding transcriptional MerR regulator